MSAKNRYGAQWRLGGLLIRLPDRVAGVRFPSLRQAPPEDNQRLIFQAPLRFLDGGKAKVVRFRA